MSYVHKILKIASQRVEIAPEIAVEYERILIDNWFDSEATLRLVKSETLQRIGIARDVGKEIELIMREKPQLIEQRINMNLGTQSASETAAAFLQTDLNSEANDPAALDLMNYISSEKDAARRTEVIDFLSKSFLMVLTDGEESFFKLFGPNSTHAVNYIWRNKHLASMVEKLWPKRNPIIKTGSQTQSQTKFITRIKFLLQTIDEFTPRISNLSQIQPGVQADYMQIWTDILTKIESEFATLYKPKIRLIDTESNNEYFIGDQKGYSDKSLALLVSRFEKFKKNFREQIISDQNINSDIWKIESFLKQKIVSFHVQINQVLKFVCEANQATTGTDLIQFIQKKLIKDTSKFWLKSKESGVIIAENTESGERFLSEIKADDGAEFLLIFGDVLEQGKAELFKIQQMF